MENQEKASESVSLEVVLRTSVDALAQIALRQQAQLQQLTAPGPSLQDLIMTVVQQAPIVLPLIGSVREALRESQPKFTPPGPAERVARGQAEARCAEVGREAQE